MIRAMGVWRRRLTGAAAFALLALVAELTGRSIIFRLDRAFHVVPLAEPTTRYYPFLLAGVRTVAALLLAAVAWRLVRAHATAAAGERLLGAFGHRHRGMPRLRLRLEPRLWLTSFAATSLWYLVQNDAEPVTQGRWPLFAPWLHTYSLPIFAGVAFVVALVWRFASWLYEVEDYAVRTFARVRRILTAALTPSTLRAPSRAADDAAPRRRFGLSFESRPPPLPA